MELPTLSLLRLPGEFQGDPGFFGGVSTRFQKDFKAIQGLQGASRSLIGILESCKAFKG